MTSTWRRTVLSALCLLGILLVGSLEAPAPTIKKWDPVGKILGKQGDLLADGVYKVTFPRNDLRITMHGVGLPVGMGLASWAAFLRLPDGQAMVMGDTVMLASEVNPVIDELRRAGIEIVALHNHMLGEQPQVLFMHYQGVGKPEALARTIRRALDQLGKSQGQ